MYKVGTFEIGRVYERDVDLLIVRELGDSLEFRNWFLSEIGWGEIHGAITKCVKHSVNTASGESDIELHLELDGIPFAVLIENKIDAVLQPDQDGRYQHRAASSQYPDGCRTVLLAPDRYGGTELVFDEKVTYESVRDWFADRADGAFAHALMEAAVSPGNGWVREVDDAVTDFWQRYWVLCTELTPELQMRKPSEKPSGSTFIYFRDAASPDGTDVVHKFAHGFVDLQIRKAGEHVEQIEKAVESSLPPAARVVRAAGSASIRVDVPVLDPTLSLTDQMDEALGCIQVAAEILEWSQREDVQRALRSALS